MRGTTTTATAAPSPPDAYPRELEHAVTLRDGARVRVRPIRRDDAERLVEFHARLSRESTYHRFFQVVKRLPPDWARVLTTVDYHRRLALVAERETPDGAELVGVARYEPCGRPGTAEIALVVRDDWQG